MNEQLAAALAAEEAAIYAYGPIGVQLDQRRRPAQARAAEAAHRDRRDVLVSLLAAARRAPRRHRPATSCRSR